MKRISTGLTILLLGVSAPCFAQDGPRVAVVVGFDDGDADEEPLDYAEADAVRFRQALLEMGKVTAERVYLVTQGGPAAVRKAFAEATGRLAELSHQGPTSLIVYVSSHADEESLHLGGEHLLLSEVRGLLSENTAAFRLAVVDACRTKVRQKSKGGRPGPEVQIEVAAKPAQVSGLVVLTAAGEGESAQEWTYLRGSLFTHHLLAGLRGLADLDGDGAVTLAEAYAYTFRRTAAQSLLTRAGVQRPSFDIQLAGFGEWVFTQPVQAGSTLVLGRGLSGTFWVADQKQELVAELVKAPDEVLKVGLKPGWYRVVKPEGALAAVAEVNLGWGGARTLESTDFVEIAASRARLRGAEPIILRPWRVSLGYGLGSGFLSGMSAQHLLGVGLGHHGHNVFWQLNLEGSLGGWRGDNFFIEQRELAFSVAAGVLLRASIFQLGLGAQMRAALLLQHVVRDDHEQVHRLFGDVESDRRGLIFGAGALATAAVLIGDRWWLGLQLFGGGYRVPQWDSVGITGVVQFRTQLAFAF